ncbi:MAG: 5-formyltetrahydrofolate cyclo-ligase [Oscillospiraceae bacterium]|nr:5-formyltetrahydrofolate cyclo-ligase [Oscillospiraceae bacterium]
MKEKLRLEMREKRRALSKDIIQKSSAEICRQLFTLDEVKTAKSVCVFLSAFNEPDTMGIIKQLWQSGKKVSAPVSDTETNTLSLFQIESIEDLHKGAYGIPEPSKSKPVSEEDIDVILVPGLAFDKKGGRMGFGKGYYDRLLAKSRAMRIGLCYDFQLMDSIPTEEHDINMNYIITEKNLQKVINNAV